MVRVLFVNGGPMHRGGIESFMMNVYRHLDRSKFEIDFAVGTDEPGEYDSEILSNGDMLFRLPKRSRHPVKYMISLAKIYRSRKYDVVHAQLDAMNGIVLFVAMICRIPMRISHSHNTAPLTNNILKIFAQYLSKKIIACVATDLWACSIAAGNWLYGSKAHFKVIHNAIDLNKFRNAPAIGNKMRKRLGLEGKFVIGHTGRFEYQKHQEFLIPILSEVLKVKPQAHLVFIGIGSNLDKVKQLVIQSGLIDHVTFAESQINMQDWYNLFDLFVMPSRFEGLSVAAVEAQANGLDCIFSDNVSREVAITSSCEFISTEDQSKWVKAICLGSHNRNLNAKQECTNSGYSIFQEVRRIERFYEEGAN